MDFSFLPLLSIFILLASSFLLLYKKKPASSGRLPPGKTGFPVIGESYEFLSAGWKGCPEKFIFDRMAKYSSQVFKTHLLGEKAAVFCGAAGHKFLFTNENKLVEAWWPSSVDKIFPNSFKQTSSSKQEGIKMKKLLQNFLKPDVGTMDRIAQMHFSSCWENKDEVEVLPLCKNYTLWVAARLFVSVEDPTEVANLVEDFNLVASGIISVPIDIPGTPFNRAIKASNKIRKHLLGMIIKKRKLDHHHHQDIMSHMLTTRDENGRLMDELDVADKILGLFIGGHHTTASACTSIVKFLAELPHIYQGVYEEQMEIAKTKNRGDQLNWEDIQKMKYSWNVACEVLRLAPPVQGGFREALEDFVFNGFSIPKGWKIYWTANSTHRNPECFPDPMNFDPSRFNGSGPARYTFVPFGGGLRMCPGKEYARVEILVFLHHLVKRFRWEKMIDDEKVIVDPMPFPAKGLPVRLFKHDHKNACS